LRANVAIPNSGDAIHKCTNFALPRGCPSRLFSRNRTVAQVLLLFFIAVPNNMAFGRCLNVSRHVCQGDLKSVPTSDPRMFARRSLAMTGVAERATTQRTTGHDHRLPRYTISAFSDWRAQYSKTLSGIDVPMKSAANVSVRCAKQNLHITVPIGTHFRQAHLIDRIVPS
jgi:hypothetical protein